MGISHLCCYTSLDLVSELKANPLEIQIIIDELAEGAGKVKWKPEFIEKIKRVGNAGEHGSFEYSCEVELKKGSVKIFCKLQLDLRISDLGDSIETQFQARKVNNRYHYMFKHPDTNPFKCRRITSGEVEAYNNISTPPVVNVTNGSRPDFFFAEQLNSKMGQVGTEERSEGIPMTQLFEHTSGDSVSMCFRPSTVQETKFFDWLNFLRVEAGNYDTNKQEDAAFKDPLKMTADDINSKLCGRKDCQGVKMFKELGIGLLAAKKGLLDEYVEVPVQAGLSHIYRKMSTHGPDGLYCRPKRLDEPFIPSRNALKTSKPPCSNRKEDKCKTKTEGECPCCSHRSR